jgi:hypothetical protein
MSSRLHPTFSASRRLNRISSVVAGALGLAWHLGAAVARAATPEPIGDPRSAGEGPGFAGDPGTAIIVVIAIGIASAVGTALYVRVTRGQQRPDDEDQPS